MVTGAGFMMPLRLTGLDFLTNECILLPALVRKSSLSHESLRSIFCHYVSDACPVVMETAVAAL